MKKSYYQKIAGLGILLIIIFAFQKYSGREKEDFSNIKFISKEISSLHVSKFNPNDLDDEQWQKLGFSEKQAVTILNYKKIVGGKFVSKEQLKKCFAISNEKFLELESYILLPETHKKTTPETSSKQTKQHIQYYYFDPNTLDTNGWENLGFTQNQAKVIINYRDKNLHGSFKNIEEIQKCFVISTEKFNELKPYIKLSPLKINSSETPKAELKQEKTDFSKLDLNIATFRQLLEFGLDEKSAGSIIGFRKKLGGFMNKQQILDTYNIDKELVQKLISIAQLNSSNITKYTLVDAPEEWLKNHPYFKYSADKIIFYRISNPDDDKIWKLLKIKPEYESRMKLYLK
ncbi:helix-hairpin-helix domain-containing protein [Chryseobacterium potabilaquae]|uniref:Helix-hairpin-helix motif-containing protein n=1 Tax=Chryseobacterium potabilaquae TaxID=2675057 RepID=A0A6N4X4G4_9FLAO|nr:helix-hairpin-helix domain-containing protein [Chryseobacterium potabilaquae]CAA7193662.1 hypothetical protein CHRY9293_00074 [Chryseobacterium potabilaquae]